MKVLGIKTELVQFSGQMPGDVLKDEEGIANMKNLGQNMAFLLKALKQEETA